MRARIPLHVMLQLADLAAVPQNRMQVAAREPGVGRIVDDASGEKGVDQGVQRVAAEGVEFKDAGDLPSVIRVDFDNTAPVMANASIPMANRPIDVIVALKSFLRGRLQAGKSSKTNSLRVCRS